MKVFESVRCQTFQVQNIQISFYWLIRVLLLRGTFCVNSDSILTQYQSAAKQLKSEQDLPCQGIRGGGIGKSLLQDRSMYGRIVHTLSEAKYLTSKL